VNVGEFNDMLGQVSTYVLSSSSSNSEETRVFFIALSMVLESAGVDDEIVESLSRMYADALNSVIA